MAKEKIQNPNFIGKGSPQFYGPGYGAKNAPPKGKVYPRSKKQPLKVKPLDPSGKNANPQGKAYGGGGSRGIQAQSKDQLKGKIFARKN